MKTILFALCMVALSVVAHADPNGLTVDGYGVRIQGFAPDGTLSQLLTVNSTTIDMTNRLAYGVYAPSAGCKVRTMATSAKGANIQRTVPDLQWTVRVVNRATPFVNFSGCTSGELEIQ